MTIRKEVVTWAHCFLLAAGSLNPVRAHADCTYQHSPSLEPTLETLKQHCESEFSALGYKVPNGWDLIDKAWLASGCDWVVVDSAATGDHGLIDLCDLQIFSSKPCSDAVNPWMRQCSDNCQKLVHIAVEQFERHAKEGHDPHQSGLTEESVYRLHQKKIFPLIDAYPKDFYVFIYGDGSAEMWSQTNGCVDRRIWETNYSDDWQQMNAPWLSNTFLTAGGDSVPRQREVTFVGEVLQVGPSPHVWSGVIESFQWVKYFLAKRVEGAPSQVYVSYRLTLDSPLIDPFVPRLDPRLIRQGVRIRVRALCDGPNCRELDSMVIDRDVEGR
jgi:hypothetical protein